MNSRAEKNLLIVGPVHEILFDEWDDALMSDLCGEKLSKPIQGLLITLGQIDMTRDSFGVNAELALKALYPVLVKLREAVIEEFNNA